MKKYSSILGDELLFTFDHEFKGRYIDINKVKYIQNNCTKHKIRTNLGVLDVGY